MKPEHVQQLADPAQLISTMPTSKFSYAARKKAILRQLCRFQFHSSLSPLVLAVSNSRQCPNASSHMCLFFEKMPMLASMLMVKHDV